MTYKITSTLLLVLLSGQSWSHHSIVSQYDINNIVTISGEVTEVWYQNPHSRVYFNVVSDDGEPVLWEAETYPRNILHRRGWKQRDLNVGDVVKVVGRKAKDGSPRVQMLEISRPSDGWEGIGYDPNSID